MTGFRLKRVDRLSSIPDDVLCLILSFLSTKQAVATSSLSKRWRHLWRSVGFLNFSDRTVTNREEASRFTSFVYSVLYHRDASEVIKGFSLNNESELVDFSHVEKWIDIVSLKRVEHIHLMFPTFVDAPPILPPVIFTCMTLVDLNVELCTVNCHSSVKLPSLKILSLEYVEFGTNRDLMELLSGSPNLEYWRTYGTHVDEWSSPSIGEFQSLTLTKLATADIVNSQLHVPFKAIQNIKFLRVEIDKVVHGDPDLAVYHNLTSMYLSFLKYRWHLLFEVLKHCPQLQNLVLDETDMDEGADYYVKEEQENWKEPEFVPKCFSFHLRTCTIYNFVGQQGELQLARFILKNARVLQTLTIRSQVQPKMIKRKLSSCPRGCATCQLLIY